MLHDIAKRKFITAGMTAWALMLPLALTSTAGWIRRLGGERWQRLHRLLSFRGAAGGIPFVWLVKGRLRGPGTCSAIPGALVLFRVSIWLIARVRKRAAVAGKPDYRGLVKSNDRRPRETTTRAIEAD